MEDKEVKAHKPKVVFVDENNRINNVSSYEKYGKLTEEMMK